MIGGYDDTQSSALDIIAKFENNEWSLYGKLRQPRNGQGSITYGTQTLIIGGQEYQDKWVIVKYHFQN